MCFVGDTRRPVGKNTEWKNETRNKGTVIECH